MDQKEYNSSFLIPLLCGDYDENLDSIELAIKGRRTDLAPRIWDFCAGMKVRIKGARPKYLNGSIATIVKVNRTKVVIRLDESASDRYTKWTNITTPLSMIEKV
jgi:hypothetical protein